MARVKFDPKVITRKLEGEVAIRAYRRLGAQVLGQLVLSTPVGLPGSWQSPPPVGYEPGHARFSWKVRLNARDAATDTPGTDPGGARTIAEGESVMRSANLKDRIVIFNNAPYIGRLNAGWSRQASSGYVERAIRAGVTTVRGRYKI